MAKVCEIFIYDNKDAEINIIKGPKDKGIEWAAVLTNANPNFIQNKNVAQKKAIGVFSGNPTCVWFGDQWYCWG
jgi:hypothetical protein